MQYRMRNKKVNSKLDRWMIGGLQRLFRVKDGMDSFYELAFVRLLWLKGSGRPHREGGMMRMELMDEERGFHVIRIADIEGLSLIGKQWNRFQYME